MILLNILLDLTKSPDIYCLQKQLSHEKCKLFDNYKGYGYASLK